jgi:hypothetical protein
MKLTPAFLASQMGLAPSSLEVATMLRLLQSIKITTQEQVSALEPSEFFAMVRQALDMTPHAFALVLNGRIHSVGTCDRMQETKASILAYDRKASALVYGGTFYRSMIGTNA